jgi:hypothetical protein
MSDLKTFRRDGIYRRRFQVWYPWGVTGWQKPRWFPGGDEWCNDSFCVVLPPLGCIVVFWRRGPMREVPCPVDWRCMAEDDRADYAPCGRLHGGHWDAGKHAHWDTGVCDEARRWLDSVVPARYPELTDATTDDESDESDW